MNNKEFIAELTNRLDMNSKQVSSMGAALVDEIVSCLQEEDIVSLQGFGTFEVKKKLERVVVNPSTKQRMLIPPKMEVKFKPSANLKEKMQA